MIVLTINNKLKNQTNNSYAKICIKDMNMNSNDIV